MSDQPDAETNVSRNSSCPYCGRPFGPGLKSTKDHVFIDARGGYSKVYACKACNNGIGTKVEGAAMRPGQLLNFGVLSGTMEGSGERLQVDLRTGKVRSANPVRPTTTDGVPGLELKGGPDQFRQILENDVDHEAYGLTPERIDELIANATRVDLAGDMLKSTHTFRLDNYQKLVAKIALGALTCVDPDFPDTNLAAELRDVLSGGPDLRTSTSKKMLVSLDEVYATVPAQFAPLAPGEGESSLIAVPLPRGKGTAIFAIIDGVAVGVDGLIVEATWDRLGELPVKVTDRPHEPEIRFIQDEILEFCRQHDFDPSSEDEE